LEYLP
jgi:hypothetical protein